MEDAVKSPVWGFGVTGYGFLDAQYPRILVETGLLGMVLFGVLIRGVFREALAVFRRTGQPGMAGLAFRLVGAAFTQFGANLFKPASEPRDLSDIREQVRGLFHFKDVAKSVPIASELQ